MAQLPLDQAIPRFKGNEDRFDKFANGTALEYWTQADGTALPTLAKFLADLDQRITDENVGLILEAEQARDAAIAAQEGAEIARDEAQIIVGSVGTAAFQDVEYFASAAQGTKADSALQNSTPNLGTIVSDAELSASFVGNGPYTIRTIMESKLSLLMTPVSLADGADISANLQALVNAAALAKKVAYIPPHPLGYTWRIDARVDLPANTKLVFDAASKTRTNAAVNTFRAMGSRVYLFGSFGAEFTHDGDGEFLDTNQKDSIYMRGFRLDVTGVTSKDGIIVSGSDTYIEDNAFGSFRNSSYVIRVVKKAGQININNKVVDNYFGGTGRAFCVSSEQTTERPEGITFSRNKSVLTGTTIVQIEAVLSLHMLDNMLDQGSFAVINFGSSDVGIQGVTIDANYIAAAQSPVGIGGGIGIRVDASSTGVIDDIRIINNEIAWSAFGISLLDKVSNARISNNSLLNIDQIAITGDADRLKLNGNYYAMTASGGKKNLVLTEKVGGGAISIYDEDFDSTGTVEIPATPDRSRWEFGRTFGKLLRSKKSVTASSPADASYVYIPHGLIRTPGVISGLTPIVSLPAVYTNVRCFVVDVDATNITVQIKHDGAVTAGNITFTVEASV